MVSWSKAQRVNNPTDKRFIEYFQIVYNYTTKKFTFNYRLVEAGIGTFAGVIENGVVTYGWFFPRYEKIMNKSFEVGENEAVDPIPVPGPVIPLVPPVPPPLVYGPIAEWETVGSWDEKDDYERRVQRRKK